MGGGAGAAELPLTLFELFGLLGAVVGLMLGVLVGKQWGMLGQGQDGRPMAVAAVMEQSAESTYAPVKD